MNISDIRDTDARKYTKLFLSRPEIVEELRQLINRNSLESDSNTPDIIIAEYLFDCLMNFNLTVTQRSVWYNPTNYGEYPPGTIEVKK